MRDLTIETPRELGAARIKLIGPRGRSFEDFNTPTNTKTTMPDAEFGEYVAIIEPVGQAALYETFTFDTASGPVLRVGDPRPVPRGEPAVTAEVDWRSRGVEFSASVVRESLGVLAEDTSDPWFFLGEAAPPAGTPTEAAAPPEEMAAREREAPQPGPRTFRVGISHDAKPFDPGGWKPVDGSSFTVTEEDEGVVLRFNRPEGVIPPPDFARLRLSAMVSGGGQQRMLVPLFSGGTRVVVSEKPDSPTELTLRVVPEDPEKLSLAQVLSSGMSSEGEAIFHGFTHERSLETYILDEKLRDPWTGILGALVAARFSISGHEGRYHWAHYLAKRFNWITDALILEAHRLVSPHSSADWSWPKRRRLALAALKRARRLGAPYFYFSNALATDLLAALAAGPADSRSEREELDEDVAVERGRWQNFLQLQGSAGAFFIWRTRAPAAPERGFDPRYTTTVFERSLP